MDERAAPSDQEDKQDAAEDRSDSEPQQPVSLRCRAAVSPWIDLDSASVLQAKRATGARALEFFRDAVHASLLAQLQQQPACSGGRAHFRGL